MLLQRDISTPSVNCCEQAAVLQPALVAGVLVSAASCALAVAVDVDGLKGECAAELSAAALHLLAASHLVSSVSFLCPHCKEPLCAAMRLAG